MSDLFERVRDLYGCATAWNANDEVPAHIQKLRAQNLKEFDRMIEQVKADAWDEGFEGAYRMAKGYGHVDHWMDAPDNPYREQEEA